MLSIEEVEQYLRQELATYPVQVTSRQQTFEEMGLDSLDLELLSQAVEDDLHVRGIRMAALKTAQFGHVAELIVHHAV